MKEMKLIIENFRKNMAEQLGGREMSDEEMEDLQKKDPKMYGFMMNTRKSAKNTKKAKEMTVNTVREKILDLFADGHDSVQAIIDDEDTELDTGRLKRMLKTTFLDSLKELGVDNPIPPVEQDMLDMVNELEVFEDDEEDYLEDPMDV